MAGVAGVPGVLVGIAEMVDGVAGVLVDTALGADAQWE